MYKAFFYFEMNNLFFKREDGVLLKEDFYYIKRIENYKVQVIIEDCRVLVVVQLEDDKVNVFFRVRRFSVLKLSFKKRVFIRMVRFGVSCFNFLIFYLIIYREKNLLEWQFGDFK